MVRPTIVNPSVTIQAARNLVASGEQVALPEWQSRAIRVPSRSSLDEIFARYDHVDRDRSGRNAQVQSGSTSASEFWEEMIAESTAHSQVMPPMETTEKTADEILADWDEGHEVEDQQRASILSPLAGALVALASVTSLDPEVDNRQRKRPMRPGQ